MIRFIDVYLRPNADPTLVDAVGKLSQFISMYTSKRWGLPMFVRSFQTSKDFMPTGIITQDMLRDFSDKYPVHDPENTTYLFVGDSKIKTHDGSTPDAITDLRDDPIEIYAYSEAPNDGPGIPAEIMWNMTTGKNILHELLHEILFHTGQRDTIDWHRSESEYWLMYKKVPYFNDRQTFEAVEQIPRPVPANRFPAINWNYISQAYEPEW